MGNNAKWCTPGLQLLYNKPWKKKKKTKLATDSAFVQLLRCLQWDTLRERIHGKDREDIVKDNILALSLYWRAGFL